MGSGRKRGNEVFSPEEDEMNEMKHNGEKQRNNVLKRSEEVLNESYELALFDFFLNSRY